MKGQPKGDKRQRTRAKLVDAAAQVIAEKGYERMSLEEVAARAGMTRGAIYGNFKDKDELILAVVRTRWRPVSVMPKAGSTFREQMHLSGKALAAAMPDRRFRARQALAFQLYALNHEDIRAKLAELNVNIYRRMEETLLSLFPQSEMPMPAARLVRVLHALSDGLAIAHAMSPGEITDELIVAAFDVFGKAEKKAGRKKK